MLEAAHYTVTAQRKGSYALPAEYDGEVNQAVLYHAVRAFLNNQRQGTHSTKTRGFVSGGNQKPWRQKGTGRARQGSIRSAQWRGGGIIFGPLPVRTYRTELPRKVRQLARRSALNARARESRLYVIEQLAFEQPKTRQMTELLEKLGLGGQKVLLLTTEHRPAVYLSARNIPGVSVMRYQDASAYDVLHAQALVIEEAALGGEVIAGPAPKAKRTAKKTSPKATSRPAARAAKKPVKRPAKPAKPKKKGSDA